MAIYLETNALRKLTNYKFKEPVYTSIFSIFELLSGITEKNFEIRKACLQRIKNEKIKINGPMIDKLFMSLVEVTKYNKFAYTMIMDVYKLTLKKKNYSDFNDIKLLVDDTNIIHAATWLKNWDYNISSITNNVNCLFEQEDKQYLKKIYYEGGVKKLAKHFLDKYNFSKIDESRLSHAEAFIGTDAVEIYRQRSDNLFSKYNFKLFIVAQAVVFSIAFINGGKQNANNASDLLHLLYLNENDIFVSNDKIYQTIFKSIAEFKLIILEDEKKLSDLTKKIDTINNKVGK